MASTQRVVTTTWQGAAWYLHQGPPKQKYVLPRGIQTMVFTINGHPGGRSPPLGPLPRKPKDGLNPIVGARVARRPPGTVPGIGADDDQGPHPSPARSSWRPSHELRGPLLAGYPPAFGWDPQPLRLTPRDGRSRDLAGAQTGIATGAIPARSAVVHRRPFR